jgi:hypothetical protein
VLTPTSNRTPEQEAKKQVLTRFVDLI